MPEKMDLKSMDVGADNRAKLKQLFPSVFTETKNKDGELVVNIDFDTLKAELGKFSDTYEKRRERYGMDWPGKKDCMKLIQKPSIAALKPCRKESVNFDDTENLFIEGDNLEVLKLLQKSYYGKIKMIYIDPPYNTGKEFIYPDDYSESLETYLSYAGLVDDQGKKFSTNTPNEGRFHTRWLNMMYPRLYLARNLLSDSGVIFISIDYHEASNLKALCNEIFGDENFIFEVCVVNNMKGRNDRKGVATCHESLLIYQKYDYKPIGLTLDEDKLAEYKETDKNGNKFQWRDLRKRGGADTREERSNLFFPLYVCPSTGLVSLIKKKKYTQKVLPKKEDGTEGCWRWGKTKVAENINILYGRQIKSSGRWRIDYKVFLERDGSQRRSTPKSIWIGKQYSSDVATKTLSKLLPDINAKKFTPKPVGLIKEIVDQSTDPDDIILDFFSGTCTAAHSVLEQNHIDSGNRKFIMIQLPELCDHDSEAYLSGYQTISDIGKERIRRVIKKIEKEQAAKAKEAKEKLPGMADEVPYLDLGFRVLKLDKSNFNIWDGSDPNASEEVIAKQLEMFVEHIDPKATQEDILYELLLKAGYLPTEKIKEIKMADKTVYSISDGSLLICLDDEITSDLINAVAESVPLQFICLDRGFQGNDQLKANAVQTFAALNQNREKAEQIIFRTV